MHDVIFPTISVSRNQIVIIYATSIFVKHHRHCEKRYFAFGKNIFALCFCRPPQRHYFVS